MPTTDFALSDADNDTRGGDARGVIGGSDGGTDFATLFAHFEARIDTRLAAREKAFKAEILGAFDNSGGVNIGGGGGGGGSDGADDQDAASSALSDTTTALGDLASDDAARLILGERDAATAHDPDRKFLSPAWNRAFAEKNAGNGISTARDLYHVCAVSAAARAMLDARDLLAGVAPEPGEHTEYYEAVMAQLHEAIKYNNIHLNAVALRETMPANDAAYVEKAARSRAAGVYIAAGGIPISHQHFTDILLEVQQKQAKNNLTKLHGGDGKKGAKSDDDEGSAAATRAKADKKRGDQVKNHQRNYQLALDEIHKSQPDWKPPGAKAGAAKKKPGKPAAAAQQGGGAQ